MLDGKRTFSRLFRNDFELAERIAGDYLIVESVIENGADISEVDIPGIARGGGLGKKLIKVAQPLHRYVLECESVKAFIKIRTHTRKSGKVDALGAGRTTGNK